VTPEPVTLRSLWLRVYLPALMFFLADGAILPIIALAARDLGASVAFAGFVVALRSLGVLFFDLPGGWIIGRYGERVAVAFASTCFAATLLGWIVSDSLTVFAVLAFVQGSGWSVWQLARMSYVAGVVGPDLRGRALSILGGISRLGWFIGPFLGAAAIAIGGFHAAYALALALALLAAVLLFRYSSANEGRDEHGDEPSTLFVVIRRHRHELLTVGWAALAMQALRAARFAIVPLWADHIGLSTATIGVLFGISTGVELLCVYLGGSIMDRHGRKAVAVPSIALIAAGIAMLPLTHHLWSLTLVAILLGLGNGISSGLNMTLGADLAPATGRAQFLGVWRVFGDIGTAGGPLAIAAVTGLLTLGGAAVTCGAIGLLAAAMIHRLVPETKQRALAGAALAEPADG